MSHRIAVVLLAVLAAGCAQDNWGPDQLGLGRGVRRTAVLEKGRLTYATYCVGCHGEQGDGAGPAARFLDPKPRDLRVGRLKFASVPAGSMPQDEDYLRTITHGLQGTAMPAFNLVPEDERRALITYVRTFYTGTPEPPASPVAIPDDPWTADVAKGLAEGKRVYHGYASCLTCHPAYATRPEIAEAVKSFDVPFDGTFRDDLYDAVAKDSDWGAPITPPDFLSNRVKAGATKEDLVRVIATGVGGTAMPSWGSGLTPEQLWGLAYYVESLAQLRGSPEALALRESLLHQPPYQPPADTEAKTNTQ